MREAGVRPARALGQHFLTDRNVVSKIVSAFDPVSVDAVIEVGPGLGVLTEPLAERVPALIAVELDAKLAANLRERYELVESVRIVESDVLETDPEALLSAAGLSEGSTYGVVGNLPYNAGTAIVRHFLEAPQQPRWLIVMLQREVAAGMTAQAGELGLLGVSMQVYADVRRLFNVPPAAFYPPPKVVSTVLRLDVRKQPLVPTNERDWFFTVVRAGFSAPRKQLRNSLAQGLDRPVASVLPALGAAGIDPALRPESLAVKDWLKLSRAVGRPRG